jgi:hypothetical protein
MIRFDLYLEEKKLEALSAVAGVGDVSIAAVIRKAVDMFLEREAPDILKVLKVPRAKK